MKTMRPANNPLHARLLASMNSDEVTAATLAGILSAPVSEIEAELEALVQLGNLSRQAGTDGEVRYRLAPRYKPLGARLLEAGLITADQLHKALEVQAKTGERLGQIMIEQGYITKQALGHILEEQRGIPYVDLNAFPIDEQLIHSVPGWVIMQHKVIPLARAGAEIQLAMLDPTDVVAMDTVGRLLGGRVRPFLITERDFDWADHVLRCGQKGRRKPARGFARRAGAAGV